MKFQLGLKLKCAVKLQLRLELRFKSATRGSVLRGVGETLGRMAKVGRRELVRMLPQLRAQVS